MISFVLEYTETTIGFKKIVRLPDYLCQMLDIGKKVAKLYNDILTWNGGNWMNNFKNLVFKISQ